VPDYDLTVTFATLKPSHLLQPCARHLGRVVIADIGIEAESRLHLIGPPRLPAPTADAHKYNRGYVGILAGEMPGAAALAASAALRAGAGYVRLIGANAALVPAAVVQGGGGVEALEDSRIAALVVGPGLGRGEAATALLEQALAKPTGLILDADALVLLAGRLNLLEAASTLPILTPHSGEFERMFGSIEGSKVEAARRAAAKARAIVVYKGSDTVVAAPDGRAAIGPAAPSWLATAGTGDVLSGIVGAMRARGLEPFEAACAGVWLHGRAAEVAGPALIADDLVAALPAVLASCA
jgi:hydroxyethylthiazole kinase-like uncharacterized protein yjeF